MLTRRTFLVGTASAGALLALRRVMSGAVENGSSGEINPFGPLIPDPQKRLDLPAGFSYRIISRTGDTMDDGLLVPGAHDGMAAFATGPDRVTLICNHELNFNQASLGAFGSDGSRLERIARDRFFDPGNRFVSLGGTTTLIYNRKTKNVERHFLSLAGTDRNCAGGPTPWGSWLSCEEYVERANDVHAKDHGWVFEVPASATGPVDPVPLKALGRFNHEAVAVDPRSRIIYLTEDRRDSLLYRFLPDPPGQARNGRLQALAIRDQSKADTRNWSGTPVFATGESLPVEWIDLQDTHAPDDDLRLRGHEKGAAIFAQGEGMWFGNDSVYFACTSGGRIRAGQIYRYQPSVKEGQPAEKNTPGQLELFVESRDPRRLQNCDNVTVTPWGDLLVCEDAPEACSLVGITPSGDLYHFAENAWSESELAGACFDPAGQTLFVNLQQPGLTLAIDGPFPRRG